MSHTSEGIKDQPNIASVLSASYHIMMGRIVEELSAAGYKDLSKLQLHIVSRMNDDTTSVNDLAKRVGIARQILDNLLSMLAENGYVRVDDEEVSLAERGQEALEIVTSAQENLESEWASLLGTAAYGELRAHLNSLFRVTTTPSTARNPKDM